jgi:hypothetical protein
MDIDSALETYLLTQSTFTSLVARRIYPDSVPPNTKTPGGNIPTDQ